MLQILGLGIAPCYAILVVPVHPLAKHDFLPATSRHRRHRLLDRLTSRNRLLNLRVAFLVLLVVEVVLQALLCQFLEAIVRPSQDVTLLLSELLGRDDDRFTGAH